MATDSFINNEMHATLTLRRIRLFYFVVRRRRRCSSRCETLTDDISEMYVTEIYRNCVRCTKEKRRFSEVQERCPPFFLQYAAFIN